MKMDKRIEQFVGLLDEVIQSALDISDKQYLGMNHEEWKFELARLNERKDELIAMYVTLCRGDDGQL